MAALPHPRRRAPRSGVSLAREHAGNRTDKTSREGCQPTPPTSYSNMHQCWGSVHNFCLRTLPSGHPLMQGTFCHACLLTHHCKSEDAQRARWSFCSGTSCSSTGPTWECELLFLEHPVLRRGLPRLRTAQEHPKFHRILQAPALTAGGARSAPLQEAEIPFIRY